MCKKNPTMMTSVRHKSQKTQSKIILVPWSFLSLIPFFLFIQKYNTMITKFAQNCEIYSKEYIPTHGHSRHYYPFSWTKLIQSTKFKYFVLKWRPVKSFLENTPLARKIELFKNLLPGRAGSHPPFLSAFGLRSKIVLEGKY